MWSHNIYTSLVQGPSDFIGKIAYSKYKQEKLDWIEEQKNQNHGVAPDQIELDKFFYPTYKNPPNHPQASLRGRKRPQ